MIIISLFSGFRIWMLLLPILATRIDQTDVILRWQESGLVQFIIGEFIVCKCFTFYLFTELNLV